MIFYFLFFIFYLNLAFESENKEEKLKELFKKKLKNNHKILLYHVAKLFQVIQQNSQYNKIEEGLLSKLLASIMLRKQNKYEEFFLSSESEPIARIVISNPELVYSFEGLYFPHFLTKFGSGDFALKCIISVDYQVWIVDTSNLITVYNKNVSFFFFFLIFFIIILLFLIYYFILLCFNIFILFLFLFFIIFILLYYFLFCFNIFILLNILFLLGIRVN